MTRSRFVPSSRRWATPSLCATKHAGDAVDDAGRKAARLADGGGVRLGPVLSIEEGLAAMPGPYRAFGAQKMSGSAGVDIPPVPVEPGSLSVTERVVLRYAID